MRTLPLTLALIVLGSLLGGCGRPADREIVLATVNDRVITAEDYKQYYSKFEAVDRPELKTLEEKKTFLDDLINKDVMEIAAFDAFPDLTTEQGWRAKRFRKSTLTNIFIDRYVRAHVKVTEDDIDTAYEHMQRDVFLDGILLPEEPMAGEMKRRIDEGEGFEELCRTYSIWESDDPEAPWEIGWSSAGQLTNWDMEVAAWEGNVGDITGPFKEIRGWWILRVGESRPVALEETKEALRPRLQNMVEKPRYLARDKAVKDSLLDMAGVQYPQEGQLVLLAKFDWDPPPEFEGDPMAPYSVPRVVPTATEEEGKVPAIVFKDGTICDVAEFLEKTSWYPSGLWPMGKGTDKLFTFMDMVVRDDAYVRAARNIGLETDPEFLKTVDDREKKMRIKYFYYKILVGPVKPTQEEIMEWFQTHRDRYKAPAGFRMALFSSEDHDLMQELRDDWVSGVGFAELRDNYEPRVDDLVYVGDSSWLREGDDPGIDGHLSGVEVGDVAPLFIRNDKVFVIRLLDRRGTRLVAYEEAKELIDKEATTHKRDKTLVDFLAKYRKKLSIIINEENLNELEIDPAESAPPAEE